MFSDDRLIEKGNSENEIGTKAILEIFKKHKIDAVIYSNVSGHNQSGLKKSLNYKVYNVNKNLKLPFTNEYKPHSSLGSDRIALICAAINKYLNKHILIIDLGTCITYDFCFIR